VSTVIPSAIQLSLVHLQLNATTDDEAVEEALSFQLEELTLMAKKELELIDRMAEWQPWDAPEVRPCTVEA